MIKDLRLPPLLDRRWKMMMMITRFFYPPSDKEACGDRCNESRCIFVPAFLIPSLTLTFTDFPHHPAPLPGEEIIVLNAEDGDDDVDDEFLMADDARLVTDVTALLVTFPQLAKSSRCPM